MLVAGILLVVVGSLPAAGYIVEAGLACTRPKGCTAVGSRKKADLDLHRLCLMIAAVDYTAAFDSPVT